MNVFRSDRWWAACVLIESFGRRQKFVFRSRQEWESVKAIVDELVRRKGWAKRLLFGRGSPLFWHSMTVSWAGVMLIAVSALLLALPGLVLLSIAGMACGFLLIAFAFFRAWANSYLVTDRRQEAVQVHGRKG